MPESSSILQLRLHPSILALRDRVQSSADGEVLDVDLTVHGISRKVVHVRSWKGLDDKSGVRCHEYRRAFL